MCVRNGCLRSGSRKREDGDAVNACRRRLWFQIGEEGEDASDVDFREHTLKVLGKRGMKGRNKR